MAREGDPGVGRFGYKGHLSLNWTDSHRAMCILHNWILSQQVPFHIHTLKRMQKQKQKQTSFLLFIMHFLNEEENKND